MKKFYVEITCDNAAFGDNDIALCQELSAILTNLVFNVRNQGRLYMPLHDTNGNRVGVANFIRNADEEDRG